MILFICEIKINKLEEKKLDLWLPEVELDEGGSKDTDFQL